MIDIDNLVTDISENSPCGEDLEYDPAFQNLSILIQGKQEQVIGNSINPAEGPDWKLVQENALALFTRTIDLRITIYTISALLNNHGIPGLATGISLLKKMVEKHWQNFHPKLDPDDDNDPTMRLNIFISICDENTINAIKNLPLVNVRGIGQFSLRDIDIAAGKVNLPASAKNHPIEMSSIEAAFKKCQVNEIHKIKDLTDNIITDIKTIESFISEQIGVNYKISFSKFRDTIEEINKIITSKLKEHITSVSTIEEKNVNNNSLEGNLSLNSQPGIINSHDDVLRVLDKVCEYYSRHEPSSPVPMLIKRAKGLVQKSFMEIINDLVPTGLKQAEIYQSPDEKKK